MAYTLNEARLIGNLGKDPEVRYLQSGTAVATFSIATSHRYKDKQGEWKDQTSWHNIKAWAGTAEVAEKYLHKGSKVFIGGRLETESWEDKESGKKMYKTVIVVEQLIMLDGKKDNSNEEDGDEGRYERQGFDQTRRQNGGTAVTAADPITDEDIPF